MGPSERQIDDDTESMHSMQSFQSDRMSIKSTQSESKLILNDLKKKLNEQQSIWGDIKNKTTKMVETYVLNASYDKGRNQEIDIAETQSLHSNNNVMDENQRKLYMRLQNNLISDLMKEKNKLNERFVKVEKENIDNIQKQKTLKQEINDKNQMIHDYKQLLSNTVHDMNKQQQLQKEINGLVEKVSRKDEQITKSTKAMETISHHLSDYINHIGNTTNYINYKINKLNQNITKIERKHQILLLKTKQKPKQNMEKKMNEFKQQLSDKDEMIQSLVEQKMRLIDETSKQFNLQRNIISLYQHERMNRNTRSRMR